MDLSFQYSFIALQRSIFSPLDGVQGQSKGVTPNEEVWVKDNTLNRILNLTPSDEEQPHTPPEALLLLLFGCVSSR